METLVIGAPYEISIEPSHDIGEFDVELILKKDDSNFGIELKKMKNSDNDYSFIIPTKLKDVLEKNTIDYSIYVYKENARFEVDSGKIKFIDEKDFKVKIKDKKAKMTPSKNEEKEKKGKDVKENLEEFIQPINNYKKFKNIEPPISDYDTKIIKEEPNIEEKLIPTVKSKPNTNNQLMEILTDIEKRKELKKRKDIINENIRKSLRKK